MARRPSARARAASCRVTASFSACTATGSPSRAARCHSREQRLVVGLLEVVDARVAHERLEADHAALGELVEPVELRRARGRPRGRSRRAPSPRAASSLRSNEAPSTVGGDAFSGMSKKHVPPPAAKAAVPVSKPSHSARPGSLKCTCGSTTPGKTWRPVASISVAASPAKLRPDLGDQAVEDPDVGPCNTVRPDHPGSADENVEGAHCRRRGYRQPDGATRTETCGRSRATSPPTPSSAAAACSACSPASGSTRTSRSSTA